MKQDIRHIEWHKTCKCKCRLDASVCNNKQRWNEDKCRCECKELIDKGSEMLYNETLDVIPLDDYKKCVILAQYA